MWVTRRLRILARRDFVFLSPKAFMERSMSLGAWKTARSEEG